MVGDWYQDDYLGGYYDEEGRFIVCEDYGTDQDLDKYSIDVQNGNGYYGSDGKYYSFGGEC